MVVELCAMNDKPKVILIEGFICSVMYAWSSHAISRPILITAELNIHDLKKEELHSNVM